MPWTWASPEFSYWSVFWLGGGRLCNTIRSSILNQTETTGFSFWKLSLILSVKSGKMVFQVELKNVRILALNSINESNTLLFLTCSFITFHALSIGFRLGLYGGKICITNLGCRGGAFSVSNNSRAVNLSTSKIE